MVRSLSIVVRSRLAAIGRHGPALLAGALALGGGALAWSGARAQAQPIKAVAPADGAAEVWSGHRVSVEFAADMDQASAEAALAITPTLRGKFEWPRGDARRLEFVPLDLYQGRRTYTVTLAAGRLRDATGRPVLEQTYRWHFSAQTPLTQPRFGDGLPLQQLGPAGRLGLPFQPGYPRARFGVRLYALDGGQFAARYAALTRGPELDPRALEPGGLTPDEAWELDIDASAAPQRIRLPDGLEAGLYLVEVTHPQLAPARELLVYSDHALVARAGRRGLLLWATRQPEGSLAPDARISAYDAAGRRIAVLEADGQGLARMADRGRARLLVAMVQGQPAVVALDDRWASRGYGTAERRGGLPLPDLVGHLHSDRPIYRPGHTVHWKAVLQQVEEAGLRPLGAGEAVTLTLRDPAGNLVQELGRQVDDFGATAGDLSLGDGAALGTWRLTAQARGQTLRGSFAVQDYVKPDFKVQVTCDQPFYVDGQSALIEVQADYYFGQPLRGGELLLKVFDNAWSTRSRPLKEIKGTLDEEGRFQARVDLSLPPAAEDRRSQARYSFEAEVTDASRRPVFASLDRTVHPAALRLAVDPGRYSRPLGQPVAVTLDLRDHAGQAAVGRTVELTAIRSYHWTGDWTGDIVERVSAVTGADGQAVVQLKQLGPGSYRLRATTRDDAGRLTWAESYVWVYSSSRPWAWSGDLAIEADRAVYQVGDTARLLVKSPFTTTALVSLEGADLLAERVVEVGGTTVVELPITAAMQPGVTARVTLWEPVRRDPLFSYDFAAEGRLLGASLRLPVDATDQRLQVQVLPDRGQARPGEPLALRLRVRDAAGRAVRAQLSVALVDQALLALAKDPAGDIFDALWAFRPSSVNSHDSWSPSSWWWGMTYDPSQRFLPRPTGAPGTATPAAAATPAPSPTLTSGGGPVDAPADEPVVQPRRDMPDTAYWNAAVLTDAQGEATLSLTLPDSLTTWQALARAVDQSGRAGQGSAEVTVSKPVSVEAALPRFLVQGDRLALDLLARNDASPQPLEGFCRLDSPGLIQLDPGERRPLLAPGAMTVARWSAVAAEPGEHGLTATLRTPMGDDAVEQLLRIEPFTVLEASARSGVVASAPVTESLDLPLGLHPDRSLVELTLTPSLASSVLGGLESLIAYPHGCVEQTMSRMLPNGVVGRLVQELDLSLPDLQARLPAMMVAGLQRLYGFQFADGSWGWWQGGGNTYITAYVLQGLSLARASGHPVDEQVLERGFLALERLIAAETDLGVQAYGLFVMAEAGRTMDAALVVRLQEQRARLDAFSLGALTLALRAAGLPDLAAESLELLRGRALRESGAAHWPGAGGGSSGRSMASSVKATAMVILVLARMAPQDPLAPQALRWLMAQRQGQAWGSSTHDTAWAALALTDWLVVSGELSASYAWRLTWDGRELAAGRHEAERRTVPAPITVRLEAADLTPGRHDLVIRKEEGGLLYYSLSARMQRFHPDFKAVAAAGSGLSLRREYMAIDGRTGVERWQPGELINVRLTLQSSQELSYVMLQDWLPAGFEVINMALNTESKRLPNGQLPWWRWWGYERRELRDEGAIFFLSRLPAGRSVFDYAVRAVTPGRFGARPAEAYAMYRPELWARSDSRRVDIALNQVADLPPLAGDIDGDCRLTGFDADLVAAAAWGREPSRDLDGSGWVDALDVALADARSGLSCGESPPAVPSPEGAARLDLAAEAAPDGSLTLTVRSGEELALATWELTLDLPTSGARLLEDDARRPSPAARALGPTLEAKGRRLRLGGYLPGGATLAAGTVLARVRLEVPTGVAGGRPVVTGALAAASDGRALTVTVGGDVVDRSRWTGRLWLPWTVGP